MPPLRGSLLSIRRRISSLARVQSAPARRNLMQRHLLLSAFLIAFCVNGFGQEATIRSSSCPSFPCVVASIALVNQTQSIHQVPIYTPTTTGFFRVSYVEQTGQVGFGGIWT